MSTFLMNCPQCACMIAKDSPCPMCRWSGNDAARAKLNDSCVAEFAARKKIHERNSIISMLLMMTTGLFGVLTAGMWGLFIYRGNLIAFVMIGVFTVLTAIVGIAIKFARRHFPIELLCPGCNERLDNLGMKPECCPSCGTLLLSSGTPTAEFHEAETV